MSVPNTSAKTKDRGRLFFSGVLILTLSNILIKVIGLLFKIPITNIITDEGMGYFNSASTIYVWFYMLSTGGFPIAVSIMVSESRTKGSFNEVKKIFRIAMILFLCIGTVGTAAMIFGSKLFAHYFITSDPAYICIIAIAPTLFFICVSSALRGFYQGYQNMSPTAVSQVIEALGKLILGIIFAKYAMTQGYDYPVVAAYAISGLTIGAAGGMIYLVASKFFFKAAEYDREFVKVNGEKETVRTSKALMKTLVFIAVPITISASVMSLTNLIDLGIVIRQLKSIGYENDIAMAIYGNYTALCVPLFNMPPILIYPISYSIIPLIKSALTAGEGKRANVVMVSSVKMAGILMIPCALGLSVLSKPILSMLFRAESVEMAAPLLSLLAPSIFFVGVLSVSNAILQACGKERLPIISLCAGGVVKLLSSAILIGIPSVGMYGTPIGTFLCYMTVMIFNFYFMSKYVGITPSVVKVFVRPLAASVVCALAAIGAYTVLNMFIYHKVATIIAIGIAALVYFITLLFIKGISKEEIMLVPKGQKIYGILHKLRLL